jgi:hypothetical protein
MTFLEAVNRLLRINTIIKGDDDNITSFSDTQHAADISLAQIAIQDELTEIISERLIPYEHTTNTISLVTSQRSYALDTTFIRFFGAPSFYNSASNYRIYEYKGGEQALMNQDLLYKTTEGSPMWFYWDNTTTKKVAFYNVPSDAYNALSLSYDFEKSVLVTNTTDTMPFHNNEENYSFVTMAATRFKYMIEKKDAGLLMENSTYGNAKSRLYSLLRWKDPSSHYGKKYC